VNGEFVGGSDIALSSELESHCPIYFKLKLFKVFQSGELETLLEQHGVIPKAQ
jgi:hypothetical protein